MPLHFAFEKTASGKKFFCRASAAGGNRPQSRAASGVWSRRRQTRVGVICYADHLGTPRAITRPSDNAVVWKWDNTDPFGANLPNENPSGLGTFKNNNRFQGQYFDEETGTHQNYYRDYDPTIGRYAQGDPLGIIHGLRTPGKLKAGRFEPKLNHIYSYVESNPLELDDPYGLSATMPWRIVGGGAAAGASRGVGLGVLGVIGASAVGAVIGACMATVNDPCAHCYEADKRNLAACHAIAATYGRPGTKNYRAVYSVCIQNANRILIECEQECKPDKEKKDDGKNE